MRLRLTVVDTPGFGDFVNNEDRCGARNDNLADQRSWKPILDKCETATSSTLTAQHRGSLRRLPRAGEPRQSGEDGR